MTIKVREGLIASWQALAAGVPGDREWRALRIELTHKLDVFAAVREADLMRGVLFECRVRLAPALRLRFESEGLRLVDEKDGRDGTRRITIALERADLEAIFLVVVEDLVDSSSAAADAYEAVATLGARLAAWQTCLKLRRDGFSQERMLGLYGELVVLERMASVLGIARAVHVWTGPDRGLHDFESGTFAIEVKAAHGTSGPVHIGSLDQLDPSGLRLLALCRVVLVPDDAGETITDLVSRVRSAASAAGPAVRRSLDRSLLMTGYLDPAVTDPPFDSLSIVNVEAYGVEGSFPRLTRENVSSAVLSVEYRLDVTAVSGHSMTEASFGDMLACFGEKV